MTDAREFIDNGWNGGRRHVDVLRELADGSVGVVKIATGFVSPKGLAALAEATESRDVLLLIGDLKTLRGYNHGLRDLEIALDWLQQPNVRVKLLYRKNPQFSWNMHAKVWVFENSAVVSSANLTGGGLGMAGDISHRQPELGVIVRAAHRVDWLDGWFEGMWRRHGTESVRLEELLAKEFEKQGGRAYKPSRTSDYATSDYATRDGCFPSLVMAGLLPAAISAAAHLGARVRQIFKSQDSDSNSQPD